MDPSSYFRARAGSRTSPVQVLRVVGGLRARQTHLMTRESVATTFITGPDAVFSKIRVRGIEFRFRYPRSNREWNRFSEHSMIRCGERRECWS